MAFTIPLTFGWLKHRYLAVHRVLFQQSSLYYLAQNPQFAQVKLDDNTYTTCPICGFSMAELILPNGWSIRACSATGFEQTDAKSQMDEWSAQINKTAPLPHSSQLNSKGLPIKSK